MGLAAALVLLSGGGESFSSQWSPQLLGATHLLTLGFMAMVMLGAMFQLVPVISGRLIPGGWLPPTLVHLLLLFGVTLLVTGFCLQQYSLFYWAGILLIGAFALFLAPLTLLLLQRIGGGDSIFCIRFAALSLLVTVVLGLLRAAEFAGTPVFSSVPELAGLHIAWGLGGWVLLLVMGASYQVIPMFHVTPSFPVTMARTLPIVVILSLLALSFASERAVVAVVICLAGVAVCYGGFTVHLLNQRKRRLPDITAGFWRLSLGCLGAAAVILVLYTFFQDLLPSENLRQRIPIVLGLLMVYGFAISVIMGMLQKIVPFLSYLHLQRLCMIQPELLRTLPHMGSIIPAARSRLQYRLHLAALLALLVTSATGFLAPLSAILMGADFLCLGITLSGAMGLYHSTMRRIEREIQAVS
jgi:hypothetical protein